MMMIWVAMVSVQMMMVSPTWGPSGMVKAEGAPEGNILACSNLRGLSVPDCK